MQNKRGISQAFHTVPDGLLLRRATVFDVFDLSRVLTRSIRLLCHADHRDDAQELARWTTNKDPASIRNWITSGAAIWMAERAGQAAAVGGLDATGKVTLLYVDPDHTGRGVGAALLTQLERELAGAGCIEARLEATKTAHGFYLSQGWQDAGAPQMWHDIAQFPMRKSLHLPD